MKLRMVASRFVGGAYTIGEVIIFDPRLKMYPRFFRDVVQHERRHMAVDGVGSVFKQMWVDVSDVRLFFSEDAFLYWHEIDNDTSITSQLEHLFYQLFYALFLCALAVPWVVQAIRFYWRRRRG